MIAAVFALVVKEKHAQNHLLDRKHNYPWLAILFSSLYVRQVHRGGTVPTAGSQSEDENYMFYQGKSQK